MYVAFPVVVVVFVLTCWSQHCFSYMVATNGFMGPHTMGDMEWYFANDGCLGISVNLSVRPSAVWACNS